MLNEIVKQAVEAASSGKPSLAIRKVLENSMSERSTLSAEIAAQPEDEILLFEDETCSIWTCRYDPDVVLPPHEHLMSVHIAVYSGTELEVLYHRDKNTLRHANNKMITEGEVVSLEPDVVHAVTAEGDGLSHALHIYEGPLTQVKRSLFDWTSGNKVEFTMDNFRAMQRKLSLIHISEPTRPY